MRVAPGRERMTGACSGQIMGQRCGQTDDRQGIGIRSCWLKGRDNSAMTEGDTGWGDPPEVAQLQDGLASQPPAGLVQRGGRHRRPVPASLPMQSQTYLIATACLAGSLVSAGLAVTDIADYPNGVGYLAILGVIAGAAGGVTATAANGEKPPGWAYRINIVAAWLALISVSTLVLFFIGQHGWYGPGGPLRPRRRGRITGHGNLRSALMSGALGEVVTFTHGWSGSAQCEIDRVRLPRAVLDTGRGGSCGHRARDAGQGPGLGGGAG